MIRDSGLLQIRLQLVNTFVAEVKLSVSIKILHAHMHSIWARMQGGLMGISFFGHDASLQKVLNKRNSPYLVYANFQVANVHRLTGSCGGQAWVNSGFDRAPHL